MRTQFRHGTSSEKCKRLFPYQDQILLARQRAAIRVRLLSSGVASITPSPTSQNTLLVSTSGVATRCVTANRDDRNLPATMRMFVPSTRATPAQSLLALACSSRQANDHIKPDDVRPPGERPSMRPMCRRANPSAVRGKPRKRPDEKAAIHGHRVRGHHQ